MKFLLTRGKSRYNIQITVSPISVGPKGYASRYASRPITNYYKRYLFVREVSIFPLYLLLSCISKMMRNALFQNKLDDLQGSPSLRKKDRWCALPCITCITTYH